MNNQTKTGFAAVFSGGVFLTVLVAALGYFVDIYDLLLFSITRKQSLIDLNIQTADNGASLLNAQMWGMLLGGILWGVLGDKKGRTQVLFGSIILYSVANILNGMVQNLEQYQWLRFVAGIGLAGELGAGITLVSEVMSKEQRGYGTTIVASVGILGAVLAYFISTAFGWRNAYFIGGGLGLLLLILRVSVLESGMFKNALVQTEYQRGNFLKLFTQKGLLVKYLKCIFIGITTWYVMGILVTFSPEFAEKGFGMTEKIDGGLAVMWTYAGLSIGDFSSGLLSQYLKSRRLALLAFIALSTLIILWYLYTGSDCTATMLYFKLLCMGFGVGFWAMFVTVASESFGTNLRATVATTVPNMARGALPLISFIFLSLKSSLGIINAALATGMGCTALALLALYFLEETFGKNLDYLE